MVTDNFNHELIARFKSNSDNGKFLISLPCGKNYGIHIEKDGFIFHSENAQLECQEGFKEINKDILAIHISGGTTEFLLIEKSDREYNTEIIGGSKDITFGQLIDRIGTDMDFPFPSGYHMEKYIKNNPF